MAHRAVVPLASLSVALLLTTTGTALAQDFTGTYTLARTGGAAITLTLRQAPTGEITGTLIGNTTFQVQAQVRGGQFAGYASAPGGRLYLEGQLQGAQLMVAMAEVGPDGQPQSQTARTVMMERVGVMGEARGAPQGGLLPGRAPAPVAGDPYAGTFVGAEINVTLSPVAGGYTGFAAYQGAQFPLQAQRAGSGISGFYQAEGETYPFQAVVQGNVMTLAAGNQTFTLERRGAAVAGGAMGAAGGGPVAGGGSPQDQQLTQLLLRSAWCSFSFSGVSGSASGRSSTERVVFRPDGSGTLQSGGESYYSGPAGAVAGQSAGGQPFQWRVQGGVLNFSFDGVTWVPTPVQITQNSSGYPIVQAGGKEYSMCN